MLDFILEMRVEILGVLLFLFFSLLNVILQTAKSILTVKGGRLTAMIMNTISYGFYTVVIKQLTTFDMLTSVIITMLANFVGVYLSILILDKFKKDNIWKISATVKNKYELFTIEQKLKKNKIAYHVIDLKNGKSLFEIYTYTQQESDFSKNTLKEIDAKFSYNIQKSF